MARLTVLCALLWVAIPQAQPRVPPLLDAAPLDPELVTPHLSAQATGPVRIGADGRAVVTVVVTPTARMHVYAADAAGYVPFTLKVDPRPGVTPGKVTYPAPETYVFPPTGETSRVYTKPFEVTQAIVVAPDVRQALASRAGTPGVVTLRYQACDDTVCYRPTTGSFVFTFVP